ncbi:hypothetical protein [Arenibaculum pallidiluteum]|nr:hypothetical protein [Arenibaculum pallidiluteum]
MSILKHATACAADMDCPLGFWLQATQPIADLDELTGLARGQVMPVK